MHKNLLFCPKAFRGTRRQTELINLTVLFKEIWQKWVKKMAEQEKKVPETVIQKKTNFFLRLGCLRFLTTEMLSLPGREMSFLTF